MPTADHYFELCSCCAHNHVEFPPHECSFDQLGVHAFSEGVSAEMTVTSISATATSGEIDFKSLGFQFFLQSFFLSSLGNPYLLG